MPETTSSGDLQLQSGLYRLERETDRLKWQLEQVQSDVRELQSAERRRAFNKNVNRDLLLAALGLTAYGLGLTALLLLAHAH